MLAGSRGLVGSSPLTRGKRARGRAVAARAGLIPAHAGKTGTGKNPLLAPPAHPRSRGENGPLPSREEPGAGSSPLTRGKLSSPSSATTAMRLIPAHAGKTRSIHCMAFCGPAHPRSRGENLAFSVGKAPFHGSSPLTRGKHFPTCAFTAQIDQILETLELAVSSGSYSVWVACATDAPQDQVRSIGLVLPSSRGAS